MDKLKVLFCSPYFDTPDVVSGGVNQWGRSIVSYYKEYGKDDVELIPVSFDRRLYLSSGGVPTWKRIISGIKEQGVAVREAKKLLKSEHPDVIHICTSGGLGLIKDVSLICAAKEIGAKSIVHLHFGRIPELINLGNLEWKVMNKVLRSCDAAIAMNFPTMEALTNNAFSNVHYLANPLSLSIINQVNELGGKIERVPGRILYVGHVARTKGVYELMEACCQIPHITLRIVGKCSIEDKANLMEMAAKSGKQDNVTFTGEMPHNQVLKEFMEADIFAFPSYSEGFPNVILEAMACGCPIASSNVGAIPEMLNMGVDSCGICYEPKSVVGIKNAIGKFLVDTNLKEEYADKAIARVNEMYAIPKVWQQIVKIWKEA